MNTKTPIILVATLKPNKGGRTQAVLKRANLLSKHFNQVFIIVMHYQQFFKHDIKTLYKDKKLNEKIKVISFFDDITTSKSSIFNFKKQQHKQMNKNKKLKRVKINSAKGVKYRYYYKGKYEYLESFDENNRLTYREFINDAGQTEKRIEYDEKAKPSRIRNINLNTEKSGNDKYLDDTGKVILNVELDPKNNKEMFTVYINKKLKHYANLETLQKKWLNQKLSQFKRPILFNEVIRLEGLLRGLNHKNIKVISVFHGTHLSKPYDDVKKIKPGYERVLKRMDKYDSIVVLTEAQKKDIETNYGLQGHITVIPHSFNHSTLNEKNLEYNPDNKTVVTLARYHNVKRLDEAIKAFKIVVKHIPDAKYNIYGAGSLEGKLKALVKKMKLEGNVFIKGYCSQPNQAYREAACSVLTSKYEGFGLVITESMAQGTPVVAYDVKYGPRELIKDGENGYLVDELDRDKLAQKIIAILQNKTIRKKLSENALKVKEKYSREIEENNWLELIKGL